MARRAALCNCGRLASLHRPKATSGSEAQQGFHALSAIPVELMRKLAAEERFLESLSVDPQRTCAAQSRGTLRTE